MSEKNIYLFQEKREMSEDPPNPIFPKGIMNLGNTCFLNACIQILSQLPLLNQFLDKQIIINPTKIEKTLYDNWNEIRKILLDSEVTGCLHPSGFLNSVQVISRSKKRPLFQENEPNDISEFLLFFIESIHCCFSRTHPITFSGTAHNETDNLAIQCYKLMKETYDNEYSEMLHIFQGIFVSQLSSTTTEEIYGSTPEMYFILDLPIPVKPVCTLYDCIDEFIKPERLEGDNAWFNEKKNQKESVLKTFLFWSFPNVLVICLKRFSFDGLSKTNTNVQYSHELDLRKYVRGYRASEYIYDLKGVCNHFGGIHNGHYTAFVKSKDNKWFYCDDEQVQFVEDTSHIITHAAYCLFYVKKS